MRSRKFANKSKEQLELIGNALRTGNTTKVLDLGARAVKDSGDDNIRMNALAWAIVDPKGTFVGRNGAGTKLLELATKAAEKAVTKSNQKDPASLDTLALASGSRAIRFGLYLCGSVRYLLRPISIVIFCRRP